MSEYGDEVDGFVRKFVGKLEEVWQLGLEDEDPPGTVFYSALRQVVPANGFAASQAKKSWDAIAHPLSGLGLLEDAVCRMAQAQGTLDVLTGPRALAVFIADNGVVAQGVSQCGFEVTTQVARNLCERTTPACIMAESLGCEIYPIDVGMATHVDDPYLAGLYQREGTGDISKGPAMSREEVLRALDAGVMTASLLGMCEYELLLAGEMGIGNTTTSACVAAALLGCEPEMLVGRGAGLSDEALAKKRRVVAQALEANKPDLGDPIDVLAKVGGFDIAAMCGFYIGAAAHGIPAILDGVISCTAALAAVRLSSHVCDYLIASHCSSEPAAELLLDELGLEPIIRANMHAGEGTGALAVLPVLDMAVAVYHESTTFKASKIKAYKRYRGNS